MSFGENLRLLRKSQKIKVNELADAMHVSSSAITKYESGVRMPDYTTLIWLSDYFNVTLDHLLMAPPSLCRCNTIKGASIRTLSAEELRLVETYRILDSSRKELIQNTVVALASTSV